MKRALFIPLLAFALAACQQQTQQQEAGQSSAVAPDGKPGIAAKDGVLVLPAVKGNPGAAYFSIFNGNDAEVTIAAVAVAGAGKAEMHRSSGDSMTPLDSVPIKPDWTERFLPGARHVMLFDLDPALAPGGVADMTIIFADGDKFTVPLKIRAAGDMMEHEH